MGFGTIRPARPSDAEALRSIYKIYVEKTTISFEYAAPTTAEFERRIRTISAECPFLVFCESPTDEKKGKECVDKVLISEKKNILGTNWECCEEKEGKIVGYAYGHKAFERAAYSWCAETSVYVDSDYRGRGVGNALYRALITFLERQGYRNLYAVVVSENETSGEFHRKNNFRLIGTFRHSGYKFGRWLDVDWFERALGDFTNVPMEPISFNRLDAEFVAATCAEAAASVGKGTDENLLK